MNDRVTFGIAPLERSPFEKYQVDARARYAIVQTELASWRVRIDGRCAYPEGFAARPGDYDAFRLSLESEWFELTLRKAAHDYLDAWLDLERAFFDLEEEFENSYNHATMAKGGLAQVQRCFYLRKIVDGMTGPYLSRVKADLEARLRGEPGKVALP